jgi:hypothetical protein
MLSSHPGYPGKDLEAQLFSAQFSLHTCNIASHRADAHWIFDRRDCMTECHFFQAQFLSRDFLFEILFAQAFQIQLFFCHCIEFDSVCHLGGLPDLIVIVYL